MRGSASGFFVCLVLAAPFATNLEAQEEENDPVAVATRYVLGEAFQTPVGPGFVVDTQGFGLRPEPHLPEMQARLARLAATFQARTGKLRDLLVCQPPSPELLGRRCRLLDGALRVLQVDEPKESEDGLLVSVSTISFHEDATGDRRWIGAMSRQIKLSRGDDGEWQVIGEGLTAASHWR
jgi:hypothetical protein